jgi:hypothetical protein
MVWFASYNNATTRKVVKYLLIVAGGCMVPSAGPDGMRQIRAQLCDARSLMIAMPDIPRFRGKDATVTGDPVGIKPL